MDDPYRYLRRHDPALLRRCVEAGLGIQFAAEAGADPLTLAAKAEQAMVRLAAELAAERLNHPEEKP